MTGAGRPEVEEPYTGPPPTARYAAPPRVPGALPGLHPPLPGGGDHGPVPWPLGPVPMAPGPHTHLPGSPLGGLPGPPAGAVPWGPPPGPPPWAVPAPLPHDVPTPFLLAMRSRTWRWWRPLLGLLEFVGVYTIAVVVVVVAGALAVVARGPVDLDFDDLTDPWVLLVTNASLAVAIPVVWLCWVAAHQMPIGSSSSVLARLRWELLARYVPLALLALGAGIAVQLAVGYGLDDGVDASGPVRSFVLLAVLVLLTTPLQSAAEEYVFRGYLGQAVAAWVGRERAGALAAAVLTATLFSLAHLPGDLLLFLDRFAFGLAASAVVWLTGGLEAAIVLHAVNNVLVLLLAGALGEGVDAGEELGGGAGLLVVALDVLAMAAYVLLVRRSVARRPPATRTPAQDLRPPGQVAAAR
ncbi:CPBP family intramembrane glutamic endopeptidase [Trujillonella endophytica]|uniref:CAAX prenyl protease 2/Lysostaphin resistance protein A-like domain-containing protein n=1 Tax=Trujillonella endophytica TaxID=673521 RepID=A0A1H8TGK9_9ACTN|nr:type II CAAX endopeptidase family protein [Trujillella endophytica]SEO90259.1 hypothetical protein SAMN05660991_02258 [Trujillella endophytica]